MAHRKPSLFNSLLMRAEKRPPEQASHLLSVPMPRTAPQPTPSIQRSLEEALTTRGMELSVHFALPTQRPRRKKHRRRSVANALPSALAVVDEHENRINAEDAIQIDRKRDKRGVRPKNRIVPPAEEDDECIEVPLTTSPPRRPREPSLHVPATPEAPSPRSNRVSKTVSSPPKRSEPPPEPADDDSDIQIVQVSPAKTRKAGSDHPHGEAGKGSGRKESQSEGLLPRSGTGAPPAVRSEKPSRKSHPSGRKREDKPSGSDKKNSDDDEDVNPRAMRLARRRQSVPANAPATLPSKPARQVQITEVEIKPGVFDIFRVHKGGKRTVSRRQGHKPGFVEVRNKSKGRWPKPSPPNSSDKSGRASEGTETSADSNGSDRSLQGCNGAKRRVTFKLREADKPAKSPSIVPQNGSTKSFEVVRGSPVIKSRDGAGRKPKGLKTSRDRSTITSPSAKKSPPKVPNKALTYQPKRDVRPVSVPVKRKSCASRAPSGNLDGLSAKVARTGASDVATQRAQQKAAEGARGPPVQSRRSPRNAVAPSPGKWEVKRLLKTLTLAGSSGHHPSREVKHHQKEMKHHLVRQKPGSSKLEKKPFNVSSADVGKDAPFTSNSMVSPLARRLGSETRRSTLPRSKDLLELSRLRGQGPLRQDEFCSPQRSRMRRTDDLLHTKRPRVRRNEPAMSGASRWLRRPDSSVVEGLPFSSAPPKERTFSSPKFSTDKAGNGKVVRTPLTNREPEKPLMHSRKSVPVRLPLVPGFSKPIRKLRREGSVEFIEDLQIIDGDDAAPSPRAKRKESKGKRRARPISTPCGDLSNGEARDDCVRGVLEMPDWNQGSEEFDAMKGDDTSRRTSRKSLFDPVLIPRESGTKKRKVCDEQDSGVVVEEIVAEGGCTDFHDEEFQRVQNSQSKRNRRSPRHSNRKAGTSPKNRRSSTSFPKRKAAKEGKASNRAIPSSLSNKPPSICDFEAEGPATAAQAHIAKPGTFKPSDSVLVQVDTVGEGPGNPGVQASAKIVAGRRAAGADPRQRANGEVVTPARGNGVTNVPCQESGVGPSAAMSIGGGGEASDSVAPVQTVDLRNKERVLSKSNSPKAAYDGADANVRDGN